MRKESVAVFLLTMLLSTSAMGMRAKGKMDGVTYVSPLGGFRCEIKDYDLGETKIDDGFGPHGGTAAFNGFFNIRRVDVEEIVPAYDESSLSSAEREGTYAWYFNENVVPLVKSGIQEAVVLYQKYEPDTDLYVTVMKLPKHKKNSGDMLRGAVQYTDGHFMYTTSVSRDMKPERWTEDQDIQQVAEEAMETFHNCSFPEQTNHSVPSDK